MAYFSTSFAQQRIVTTDIKNFWQAYDQIKLTTDSAKQVDLINQHYIQKGTPGLKALMQVRNYNAQGFVNAIKNYPQFWASVRNNTLKADDYAKEIEKAVILLKELYPELKPATIYFSIGALRTGGTTLEDKVLIGAEISMTDEKQTPKNFKKVFHTYLAFLKPDPLMA